MTNKEIAHAIVGMATAIRQHWVFDPPLGSGGFEGVSVMEIAWAWHPATFVVW